MPDINDIPQITADTSLDLMIAILEALGGSRNDIPQVFSSTSDDLLFAIFLKLFGGTPNFANANLVLTGYRSHNLNGNDVYFYYPDSEVEDNQFGGISLSVQTSNNAQKPVIGLSKVAGFENSAISVDDIEFSIYEYETKKTKLIFPIVRESVSPERFGYKTVGGLNTATIATEEYIKKKVKPYYVYSGFFTQIGENPPVVDELENTCFYGVSGAITDSEPFLIRNGVGDYEFNMDFLNDEKVVCIQSEKEANPFPSSDIYRLDVYNYLNYSKTIIFKTYLNNVPSDNAFKRQFFEFRFYPV